MQFPWRKLLSSVAFAAISASAWGADLPTHKAPPQPMPDVQAAFSWTGFYLGGALSGNWSQARTNVPSFGFNFVADPSWAAAGVGITGGYRYQLPSNIVLGIAADATWLSQSKGRTAYYAGALPGGADGVDQVRATGSLDLTFGYALGRWLPYLTGGLALANEAGCATLPGNSACFNNSFSSTRTGWNVGVGGAYAITDHLIASAEFRYDDYGSRSYSTPFVGGGTTVSRLRDEKLIAGLSWKF